MTNLNSKKNIAGKVERLQFYVADKKLEHLKRNDNYFNYRDLIFCIAKSVEKWGETYNVYRNKIDLFIQRYDEIVSDKRYGYVDIK